MKQILKTKMILGALTIEDLRSSFVFEHYSLGKYWNPINNVRRRNRKVIIRMGYEDVMMIPIDTIVKVEGNIARFYLDVNNITNAHNIAEKSISVRIQLSEELKRAFYE